MVLGVDNIVALSIIVARLPEKQRQTARLAGLALALVARLIMVYGAVWLLELNEPVFGGALAGRSIRDLILLAGGAFLIWKATREIHHTVELKEDGPVEAGTGPAKTARRSMAAVVLTIVAVDVGVRAGLGRHRRRDDGRFIDDRPRRDPELRGPAVFWPGRSVSSSWRTRRSRSWPSASSSRSASRWVWRRFTRRSPKPYIYLPMAFATGVQLLQWRLAKNEAAAGPPPKKRPPSPQPPDEVTAAP